MSYHYNCILVTEDAMTLALKVPLDAARALADAVRNAPGSKEIKEQLAALANYIGEQLGDEIEAAPLDVCETMQMIEDARTDVGC